MQPCFPAPTRLFTHGALILCIALAAGCDNTPDLSSEAPDASRSTVELSRPDGARADGVDAVEVRVTVRSASGAALEGRTVMVEAEGDGISVAQPTGPTDAQGVAIARLTATTPGTRVITASVAAEGGRVTLAARPTVSFVLLPASRLAFGAVPAGGFAGEVLSEVEVRLEDAEGRRVTEAQATVTLSLGSGPASAVLHGNLTARTVQGVARFNGLRLDQLGEGYTLLANAEGLTGASSAPFNIAPGAAASLVLEGAVGPVTAGTALDVTVTARDVFGNTATGYRGTVRFTSDDPAAQLPADFTFSANDAGRRKLTGAVVLARAGTREVRVTDLERTALTSKVQVEVTAAAAKRLAFVQQPGNRSVREAFGVQVQVQDAWGNGINGSTAKVSLSAGEGIALAGTTTADAVGGVASFTGLSFAQQHPSVTLTATAAGLSAGTSAPFEVRDDVPPAQPVLALTSATATSLTVAWTAVGDDGMLDAVAQHALRYASQPILTHADFDAATPVPLGTPAAPGTSESATLTGLSPHTTYHVALEVTDDAGNTVRSASLPVSTPFATAARLAFLDSPASLTAGVEQSPLRVAVEDADGVLVDQADSAVSLSVEGEPGAGPWTVTAVDGVATFPQVRVDRAGTGYRLVATSGGLTEAHSSSFDVTPAAAARLAMTGLPSTASVGDSLSVTVSVLDAFDNPVPDALHTVSLASTDAAATLPAPYTLAAGDGGQHTFTGIRFETGGAQTLTVSATGLTDDSASIQVEDLRPTTLVLSGLPSETEAGEIVTVTVAAHDANGRVAPGYRGTVRLQSDDAAATLPADYTFTAADAGVHSFQVLLVTAGARTLTVVDVADPAFSDTASTQVHWAAASSLVLSAPTTATAGDPFFVTVNALDPHGNLVRDYAGTVSFDANPSATGLPADTLFSPADEGSRIFTVTLQNAGATTLGVQDDGGLVASSTIQVGAASAAELVFSVAAGPFTAGAAFDVDVTARDAFGNTAGGYRGTVALTSGDAQAVLPPPAVFTEVDAGRRTFHVLLATAGQQQLVAQDDANAWLRGQTAVTVVPGAPEALRFAQQPAGGTVRAALAPVAVELVDGYGNLVAANAPTVSVMRSGGTGAATLSGTLAVIPTAGVASFTDLELDQQVTGIQLKASATGLTDALTTAFDVVDDLPPGQVSLSVANLTQTSVTLTWTAVGDDGLLGQASAQELRYATSPLTAQNFASGTAVALAAPTPSGTSESVTVSGLDEGIGYHFALRITDDAGNDRFAFVDASTAADACLDFACTANAPTCAADGVSLITYAARCLEVNGAPTCEQQPTTTACPGSDAVCSEGACTTATPPGPADLVISEVMHSPSAGTSQYVELTNTTDRVLNLTGVTLTYTDSQMVSVQVTVGTSTLVAAHSTFVLAQNAQQATNGGVPAQLEFGPGLTLGTEGELSIALGTTTLDSLTWDSRFPQTPGRAMSLSSAIFGTSASANPWYWCDATGQLPGGDFGTPGALNGDCGVQPTAPIDFCAIQAPQTFSSAILTGSSWPITGWFFEPWVTDLALDAPDDYPHVFAELGYGTDNTDPEGWTWTEATLTGGTGMQDEVTATLSIPTGGNWFYGFRYRLRDPSTGDLSDWTYCDQNGAVTPPAGNFGTVTVMPAVVTNHLVISELAAEGPGGASDEFVEIYNPTNSEISLAGWKFQYKSATGSTWSSYNLPTTARIAARGYYLVGGSSYSGPRADATYSAFSMGAGGGHARLLRPDGTTVDDLVGFGSANAAEGGNAIKGTITASGSYERKAVASSTAVSMAAGGTDADRGNGHDTDNNGNDFVLRTTRDPQNSASPIEF